MFPWIPAKTEEKKEDKFSDCRETRKNGLWKTCKYEGTPECFEHCECAEKHSITYFVRCSHWNDDLERCDK